MIRQKAGPPPLQGALFLWYIFGISQSEAFAVEAVFSGGPAFWAGKTKQRACGPPQKGDLYGKKTVCFDLTGKVAIVHRRVPAGSASNLPTSLAEYGANLALMAGNEEKLKKTAAAIVEKTGVRVITVKVEHRKRGERPKNAVKTVMECVRQKSISL